MGNWCSRNKSRVPNRINLEGKPQAKRRIKINKVDGKKPSQSKKSIKLGDIVVSGSHNINISPQINQTIVDRKYKLPSFDVYNKLKKSMEDRSTHIQDHKKCIIMYSIILYIPTDFISQFLHVLSRPIHEIVSFLRNSRKYKLSIAVIHKCLNELSTKGTQQFYQNAVTRYRAHLEAVNELKEDDELPNLYCMQDAVRDWDTLNIIKFAFHNGLENDVIYLINAFECSGGDIQNISLEHVEQVAAIYNIKGEHVENAWKFFRVLNRAITFSYNTSSQQDRY